MIAERNTIHSYSNSALDELGLANGYCDFGFPHSPHGAADLVDVASADDATLPAVQSSAKHHPPPPLPESKLDRVVRSFSRVYDDGASSTISIPLLLDACRALLDVMRSNGTAALRLAAADFESNLAKVEALWGERPRECRTLRSLLELERREGAHDGNVLRDPSAAIGLLWIRRSLSFQSHLYGGALVVSKCGRSRVGEAEVHPRDVAREAYDEHLSPHHGYMLRTVFPASFSCMPRRSVFLSKFGEVELEDLGEEEEAGVVEKLRVLVETLEPLLRVWKKEFQRLDLEDTRRV